VHSNLVKYFVLKYYVISKKLQYKLESHPVLRLFVLRASEFSLSINQSEED